MDQLNKDLWKTMNEPDIDPLMEDAIRVNDHFRHWWLHKLIPEVLFEKIIKIKPNFTREPEAASHQSKSDRETDLHIEIQDSMGYSHAILIESKINAPLGENQLEDYIDYAQWGKEKGRWMTAVTVLMAPEGYLTKSTLDSSIKTISYEEISEQAISFGLQELSTYLLAGIKRYKNTDEPRNPDEIVSAFRIKYADFLRDEYPRLYEILSARSKKLFDGSQKWFYFSLKDNVEIVHKISNNKNPEQNDDDEQYLSLHVPGMGAHLSDLPDLRLNGSWRPAVSNSKNKSAIYDIPLSYKARMFFRSFDTKAPVEVWNLTETLREKWEELNYVPKLRR